MFDKPNQIIFYLNVISLVFGVFVALLTDFAVIGLTFASCAALLIVDQIRQNKLAFSISDLKKLLTVHDTCGKKATLTQTQMTTACHSDNSEYWFKNIRAIGNISNFRINNNEPAEQRKEGENYQICVKFPPELKATNGTDLTLTTNTKVLSLKTKGFLPMSSTTIPTGSICQSCSLRGVRCQPPAFSAFIMAKKRHCCHP